MNADAGADVLDLPWAAAGLLVGGTVLVVNGCMDLYAEDAVQLMPDGVFEGRSKIRERLGRELAGLPDVHFGFTSFVEQGDTFADE